MNFAGAPRNHGLARSRVKRSMRTQSPGDIAQMAERVLCMHKVRGSIPCVSIFCFLRLHAHTRSHEPMPARERRRDLSSLFRRFCRRVSSVRTAQGRTRAPLAMAAGPKSQYAHLANLAVDFVRKRPNRACPPSFPLSRRCLLYTSPSPRDGLLSRMPSSA